MGYPYSWGEKGIEDHCGGGGAGAFGSHRRRPEYEAEIRVAGADRAAVGRGGWHDGGRASGREIQARGVAVAGTVRRRRRGWLAARPATFGAASDGWAGPGVRGGGAHAAHGGARRHALEHAQLGSGGWPGQDHHPEDLARAWAEA